MNALEPQFLQTKEFNILSHHAQGAMQIFL